MFPISAQKHRLWVLIRTASNEFPQSMFWAEIWKILELFYLEIFLFLVVKFSLHLNWPAFVIMWCEYRALTRLHKSISKLICVCASLLKSPVFFSAGNSKAIPLMQSMFICIVGYCNCTLVSSYYFFLIVSYFDTSRKHTYIIFTILKPAFM